MLCFAQKISHGPNLFVILISQYRESKRKTVSGEKDGKFIEIHPIYNISVNLLHAELLCAYTGDILVEYFLSGLLLY